MSPAVATILLRTPFNPYRLPGLAARYDVADLSSLSYDGSNRVGLLSDKSGNSGVNGLVLNGVSGNYASTPDSGPLGITGDIDIRVRVAINDATPSTVSILLAKEGSATTRSYRFAIATSGALFLMLSDDGSSFAASATSSASIPFADFTAGFVRVTWRQSDGRVQFFTSTDGATWSQLGTDQTISLASIFDSTSVVELGSRFLGTDSLLSGSIYRAQIRNNILDDGTGIVFDADFTQVPKLATSFTESSANAATVTINASGATGARISGARDLYQATSGNKGIITLSPSGNYITTDGLNDFWKSAPFPLTQPTTVYFVGSQVTWTSGLFLFDGTALSGSMGLVQRTTTPEIAIRTSAVAAGNTALPLNTRAVVAGVWLGSASTITVNRNATTSAAIGTDAPNGFIIGANALNAAASNITVSEVLIFSAAHSIDLQLKVAQFLMKKWLIG